MHNLDLSKNSLGSEGIESFAPLLNIATIENLNMHQTGLDEEACKKLAGILISSHGLGSLHHLDISGNDISKEFFDSIISIVEKAPSLKVLRAHKNNLLSIGVKQLVKALPTSIEELYLGSVGCGTVGASTLVNARKQFSNLKILNVSGNNFSPDDILALQETYGDVLVNMEGNISDEDTENKTNHKTIDVKTTRINMTNEKTLN